MMLEQGKIGGTEVKFLIDDADITKIREIYEYYPVDGVTTNPSILAKAGGSPQEVLREIRSFIGQEADIHVQVVSRKAEAMAAEAQIIREALGERTYIKVPVIPEGLKAIRMLSAEGYLITATAIYTPMQAFLAAKAGADFAAPYVNRIDNLGADGVETAKTIHDMFVKNNCKTEVLAASFKNARQVSELCRYGVGGVTVGADLIKSFLQNDSVTAAVDAFCADFEGLCGKEKTMSDIFL